MEAAWNTELNMVRGGSGAAREGCTYLIPNRTAEGTRKRTLSAETRVKSPAVNEGSSTILSPGGAGGATGSLGPAGVGLAPGMVDRVIV